MDMRRAIARAALLAGAWMAAVPAAHGQFFGGSAGSAGTGLGVVAVPSTGGAAGGFGLMAVPTATGPASQSGRGGAAGLAGTAADPLGMSYVYGPAVPMTPGQAGLFLLSTQQRMLGLGSGQRSGVRPGPSSDSQAARGGRLGAATAVHPAASHTRDSNLPGGQAARYFNRAEQAEARRRPYYNRPLRQFPQTNP